MICSVARRMLKKKSWKASTSFCYAVLQNGRTCKHIAIFAAAPNINFDRFEAIFVFFSRFNVQICWPWFLTQYIWLSQFRFLTACSMCTLKPAGLLDQSVACPFSIAIKISVYLSSILATVRAWVNVMSVQWRRTCKCVDCVWTVSFFAYAGDGLSIVWNHCAHTI